MSFFCRTLLLMGQVKTPPSSLSIEDELTAKVDYIYSLMKPDDPMRGVFSTPFGMTSENRIYKHPVLLLETSSLAPYIIRHHRDSVSKTEIKWINQLYDIVRDVKSYYRMEVTKPVYYLKIYNGENWKEQRYIAKVNLTSPNGLSDFLGGAFFEELTESEFNEYEIVPKITTFERVDKNYSGIVYQIDNRFDI